MKEITRYYRINADEQSNPQLIFELRDGAEIIHELREDLWTEKGTIEFELTIRYMGRNDK